MKRHVCVAALMLMAVVSLAAQAPPAGWKMRVDRSTSASDPDAAGTIKFVTMGTGFHATNPQAAVYWNPANTASGNYTVEATFAEREYMGLNSHPHPYGIMIGGNDMGTDNQTYLYCAAYGAGNFIVRGFGPAAFQMNGGRGEMNDAVNKATAKGQPVSNKVAIKVSADKVECIINDKTVASYAKTDIVGAGKLKSTDGLYGIRFGHNTDAHISGLKMTKN